MKKIDTSGYPSITLQKSCESIIIALFLFFIGGFIGWSQFYEAKDLFLSKQWPFTQGRVQRSELFWTEGYDMDLPGKVARISYSYSVGSQVHKGKVSTYSSIFTSRVNRLSEKYPYGSQITVYYNPNNPDISIVEPGLNISLLGIVSFIAVIYGGVWMLKGLVGKKFKEL